MKDFAKPKPKKNHSKHAVLQKVLTVALLLLIAATVVLLVLRFQHQRQQKHLHSAKATVVKKAPQPTFDFYSVLKHQKVEATSQPMALNEPKTSADTNHYILRVASLKDKDAANSLVARLVMLGLNSNVQTYQQQHITWNRVIVGPFASLTAAQKTQDFLSKQNIHSFLVKKPS